jgi:hypothetical protein
MVWPSEKFPGCKDPNARRCYVIRTFRSPFLYYEPGFRSFFQRRITNETRLLISKIIAIVVLVVVSSGSIFFWEGPRSRSYGRTAALRLLVQPCYEDEEKDGQFFFSLWQGKTEALGGGGGEPGPVPLCPPQIPHVLTRDQTRASEVGGRRLTAWAMARPSLIVISDICFRAYTRPNIRGTVRYISPLLRGSHSWATNFPIEDCFDPFCLTCLAKVLRNYIS